MLVYPIMFLYRQYAELRLKQLARDACDLLGEPYTLRVPPLTFLPRPSSAPESSYPLSA